MILYVTDHDYVTQERLQKILEQMILYYIATTY